MKTFWAFVLFFVSVGFLFLAVYFDLNQKLLPPVSSGQKQEQASSTTTEKQNQVSTSTPTVKKSATTKKALSVITQVPSEKSQTVPQPTIDLAALNTQTRAALVNILCQTQAGGPLSPISGSGVLVSSDGVILTVAHVAEFFLLRNFYGQNSVQCVIRVGSPAYPTYNAELVYISPSWVAQNKSVLLESTPTGTGEHDYAFLRITGRIDGSQLPTDFPFLSINTSEIKNVGDFALLAAYPAGFLGSQSILQNLFQSSAETTIQKIYTFSSATADVISLPGTIISQSGSSGGAVVSGKGELIGLISTDTAADQTSGRDLRAITTGYIARDLKAESGSTIADILASSATYAKNFNATIAPKLAEILTDAILQK